MPRWIVFGFLIGVWILGILLGGIIEKTYFGGAETTVLQAVVTFDVWNPEWWGPLTTILLWDFALFESPIGQLIRYVFLGVLSAGVAIWAIIWAIGTVRGSGI